MKNLQDKVVVVTGAARGIGRGIAMRAAAEGARVVVADFGGELERRAGNSSAPAEAVVAEIVAGGGEAVACAEDVSTLPGGARIVDCAVSSFGRIDGLVCCAGLFTQALIQDMSEAQWDDVMASHLKGHFSCTRAAAPVMIKQKSGRMIYFSSAAALTSMPHQPSYSAAKAGVLALMRSSAQGLRDHGIRVNCILPGGSTRMTDEVYRYLGLLSDQPGAPDATPVTRASGGSVVPGVGLRSELAQGTWRDPANVAPFVTYLLSDRAERINGQAFAVVGHQVTLVHERTYGRTIRSDKPWTFESLAQSFEAELQPYSGMADFQWPPA